MKTTLAAIAALMFAMIPAAHATTTAAPAPTPVPVLQDAPDRPMPPEMAAEGYYALKQGDPLPAGVVWSAPDMAFKNGPVIGDPPSSSQPTTIPDWQPTPCSDHTDTVSGFHSPSFIWAIGSESTIRVENPWGNCTGQLSDSAVWTALEFDSYRGHGSMRSGATWPFNWSYAQPFYEWHDGGNIQGSRYYGLAINAGDSYNYWTQTVNVNTYGCPPGANYNHCIEMGIGYLPLLAVGVDLLDGTHNNFYAEQYSETGYAETSLQGGVSNPAIYGSNQVQNPASGWVGLPAWNMDIRHPGTGLVDALNTYGIVEVWQN